MKNKQKLNSNLWKIFFMHLTTRRNYIPILSIYFLSLPDSTAQQLGLFTGIGWLVGFIAEIPSGYFADTFGHKKSLIISKFFILGSTLFFVFGDSITFFALGSSFIALGFAFASGTASAFLHNTLIELKKDKKYAEIDGKIRANVSFISALLILALPLLSEISLVMPIKAYLFLDVLGIIIAFSLFTPPTKYHIKNSKKESILAQLLKFKNTGFYSMSLLLGLIGGFIMAASIYREPLLESLGLPIILIGFAMALSRFIWYVVGHNIRLLKKISIKKLLIFEIISFSFALIATAYLSNPYIVGSLLAIIAGYYQGRKPIFDEYYINNFLNNKKYKATMLSVKSQIGKIFESLIVFALGFLMIKSYSIGFATAGITVLLVSLTILLFISNLISNKR